MIEQSHIAISILTKCQESDFKHEETGFNHPYVPTFSWQHGRSTDSPSIPNNPFQPILVHILIYVLLYANI